MNKLPLTNINKFTQVLFKNGKFKTSSFFIESFYIEGGFYDLFTVHKRHSNSMDGIKNEIIEGVAIKWNGDPFNLDFDNDNYLILTNIEES